MKTSSPLKRKQKIVTGWNFKTSLKVFKGFVEAWLTYTEVHIFEVMVWYILALTMHIWTTATMMKTMRSSTPGCLLVLLCSPLQPLLLLSTNCLYLLDWLTFSRVSYKWDHAMHILWYGSSSQHNCFETHPCCTI